MIKHLHLDRDGIEMFIGHLEAEILRVFWSHRDPLTGNQLLNIMVRSGRDIAPTTLHTTITRMAKKDLLRNFKLYPHSVTLWEATTESEESFIKACIAKTCQRLYEEHTQLWER